MRDAGSEARVSYADNAFYRVVASISKMCRITADEFFARPVCEASLPLLFSFPRSGSTVSARGVYFYGQGQGTQGTFLEIRTSLSDRYDVLKVRPPIYFFIRVQPPPLTVSTASARARARSLAQVPLSAEIQLPPSLPPPLSPSSFGKGKEDGRRARRGGSRSGIYGATTGW